MLLESLLAYAHFVAILSVVVFITSEAALCRAEWLNAAVVRRLARVDVIYLVAALAVLATGLARTWWGMKGMGWYWQQPLLHLKLTLFVVIGLISIQPTLAFRRWVKQVDADGTLPDAVRSASGAPPGHDPGPHHGLDPPGWQPAGQGHLDPLRLPRPLKRGGPGRIQAADRLLRGCRRVLLAFLDKAVLGRACQFLLSGFVQANRAGRAGRILLALLEEAVLGRTGQLLLGGLGITGGVAGMGQGGQQGQGHGSNQGTHVRLLNKGQQKRAQRKRNRSGGLQRAGHPVGPPP
jgi:putative membrane protein